MTDLMQIAATVVAAVAVGFVIARVWLVDQGVSYTDALERAYRIGQLHRPTSPTAGEGWEHPDFGQQLMMR